MRETAKTPDQLTATIRPTPADVSLRYHNLVIIRDNETGHRVLMRNFKTAEGALAFANEYAATVNKETD